MSTTIADILARGKSEEENGLTRPEGIDQPLVNVPQVTIPQNTVNKDLKLQYPKLTEEEMYKIANGGNTFDFLLDKYIKPKPVDEKKLANSRTLGSIGDSLKLLGQMFAAGKGAHIRENKPGTSLTDYFLNEENRIRGLYEKNNDYYNRTRLNFALQEYARSENEKARRLSEKFQAEQNDKKLAYDNYRYNNELAFKKEKENNKNVIENKRIESTNNYREAQIASSNTQNAIRLKRLENQNANSSTKEKKDYVQLASEAMKDEYFINHLPDRYFTIRKDKDGIKEINRTIRVNKEILGETYYRYLQNKNSQQTAQQANQNYQAPDSWQKPNWGMATQPQNKKIPTIPYRLDYVPDTQNSTHQKYPEKNSLGLSF